MLEVAELTSLGFTETEAKTYLALLELGSGSVATITHRADITRTLGYHSLNRLIDFGLIEQKKNSHPAEFHVKHPKLILNYLEKEKGIWETRLIAAQTLLPKLESSYTMLGRPYLSNRIGKDDVFDLYRILYTSESSIISVINPTLLALEDLKKIFEFKSVSTRDNITCIFDTIENRAYTINAHIASSTIHWVTASNIDLGQEFVETIVTKETLYTITQTEQGLRAENITHQTTVQSMYTLLYTLINE